MPEEAQHAARADALLALGRVDGFDDGRDVEGALNAAVLATALLQVVGDDRGLLHRNALS